MVPVVMVGVSVHQEFQASQEALDSRDHPVSTDQKDSWAHGETKAMKVLEEVKVLQVPRVPQDRLVVIGNNAFLRREMEGTPD